MNKIRLISKYADAIAILPKILDEGDKVDFWVQKPLAKATYEGFNNIPQIKNWNDSLSKDTAYIFDMVGTGQSLKTGDYKDELCIAEKLVKAGYNVIGGGLINDKLELNRHFGINVAKKAGIKIPYFEKFTDFDKAIEMVEKGEVLSNVTGEPIENWVFKPENNTSTAYTYVGIDTDDMIEMLHYFSSIWKEKIQFVMQEKVEGAEVSTEMWYVKGKPVIRSLNQTWETKKFLYGDEGPDTGCMSSVVKFGASPKLYVETLHKLEPFLAKNNYTGPLDINCIVADYDKKPYFLELTCRFGYNAFWPFLKGLNMPIGDFFAQCAKGEIPDLDPFDYYLGAVRVSIPPWPNHVSDEEMAETAGKPIRGKQIENENFDDIWLLDAKKDGDRYVTAGVDGAVCEVTAEGDSIEELEESVYEKVDAIILPNRQCRRDGIRSIEPRIDALREYGYLLKGI